jgi:hypothetical protein
MRLADFSGRSHGLVLTKRRPSFVARQRRRLIERLCSLR